MGVASWTSLNSTGPKSHSSMSKKWMPMFVARPPERSTLPFQEFEYQGPREEM